MDTDEKKMEKKELPPPPPKEDETKPKVEKTEEDTITSTEVENVKKPEKKVEGQKVEKEKEPQEKEAKAVEKKKEKMTEEKTVKPAEKTKVDEKKKETIKEKEVKAKKPEKTEEKKEEKEKKKKPVKTVKEKESSDELLVGFSPLIFGKFDLRDVVVEDPGLKRYINLRPVGIPHTGAKHANKWFGKIKVNIVERLINNLMRTEHTTGKKSFTYRAVKNAFDIIEKRTKQNPVQVLIKALENSSPKEEITRLRFGGISVPKAVDTSASHRLDVALRNICKGAVSSSHRNKKRMEVCIAEEIILASKADMNSFAISKKEEMERIAASAR